MRKLPFPSLRSLLGISDEQAMWRVQQSDDELAFAGLVRRWEAPIQRLCERMTGDAHAAEDLAQETFVRVYSRRKEYAQTAKFSTWLWRIALNLCYDELRRRERRNKNTFRDEGGESFVALEAFAVSNPTPDKLMVERERSALVKRALDELPEIYRTILVLRHYENLKFREIAEVLGVPEGTVKSRMAEALAQFEAHFARWSHDSTDAGFEQKARRPSNTSQSESSVRAPHTSQRLDLNPEGVSEISPELRRDAERYPGKTSPKIVSNPEGVAEQSTALNHSEPLPSAPAHAVQRDLKLNNYLNESLIL